MIKIIRLAVVIGSVFVGIMVFSISAKDSEQFDPAITGFGNRYKGFDKYLFNGLTVRGETSTLVDSMRRVRSDGGKIALWLGASQLHSLSFPKDTDAIAIYYANERASKRDSLLRYFQISYGNATLYELLAAYIQIRQNDIKPNLLIVALAYDDLRESGFREKLIIPVQDELEEVGGEGIRLLKQEIQESQGRKESVSSPVERSAIFNTPQERIENKLLNWIEELWRPYSFRGKLKGKIDLFFREKITGVIFRIYKRGPVLVPERKIQWNLKALESFMRITKFDGTKLIIYRQPILIEKDFYHDRKAYEIFFDMLSKRLQADGVDYVDLEGLVPTEDFGLTNSDLPDHFHFNVSGHKLLGTTIDTFIEQIGY